MDFGWGELEESEVLELASFVTLYRRLEFDLPAAQAFGSALLAHVAASLDQWSGGGDGVDDALGLHSELAPLRGDPGAAVEETFEELISTKEDKMA